jgi:hypothetical protein
MYRLHLQLLVTAKVPSSPILVTLMIEEKRTPETSVLTRATQHHIAEDGILHSHRFENRLHHQLLFMANFPSSPICVTLMMDSLRSAVIITIKLVLKNAVFWDVTQPTHAAKIKYFFAACVGC